MSGAFTLDGWPHFCGSWSILLVDSGFGRLACEARIWISNATLAYVYPFLRKVLSFRCCLRFFVSIDLYAAGLAHNCPAIPVESVFVLGVVFVP